jgi:hypothetical protein
LGFTKGIFDASLKLGRFVSLAGVFDIPQHYRYEIGRGVARFSPMSRACSRRLDNDDGEDERTIPNTLHPINTLAGWRENSPFYDLVSNKASVRFPDECLVVHGTKDTTCPCSYSERFGEALKAIHNAPSHVDIEILETGHAEMVLELMFGGVTQDIVMDWLHDKCLQKVSQQHLQNLELRN